MWDGTILQEGSHFQVTKEACRISDERNFEPEYGLSYLTLLIITDCFSHIIRQLSNIYFKHILLSYKTRQMDKTQVVNLWSLLRYIYKH
jgi:hypothetical protein